MAAVKNYLVVSALGEDNPRLIDELSRTIVECDCRIEDCRMTVLGNESVVILMVRGNWNTLAKLEVQLKRLEQSLDLVIVTKRTGERKPEADALPYTVEVISAYQPGIVYALAHFFSSRAINIEELMAHSYDAPHTRAHMFSVNVVIGIPAHMPIALLREEFMDFCDDLNLDAVMEPIKG